MRFGKSTSRPLRTPIGLDVGSRFIKALQFAPYSSGLRVAAAAMLPRAVAPADPEPAATSAEGRTRHDQRPKESSNLKPPASASADPAQLTTGELRLLSDALFRSGFQGNHLVLALLPADLLQNVLELPPRSSQSPLEQIARLELARSHKCAPESFEMGCWDLPPASPGQSARASKGTSVMAIGYPRAAADALLDTYESAGLLVVALEAAPCALARACAPAVALVGPEGGMTAILDVGWSAASLSMLHCGAVIYGRTLADGGLGTLHRALSRWLNLEPEVSEYLLTEVGMSAQVPAAGDGPDEAIDLPEDARGLLAAHFDATVRELLASFSYAARLYPEAPVSRLLLTGGGAAIPQLGAHLSSVLGVETQAISPAEVASYDADLMELCHSPLLTSAAGLALFPEV